jgi:hypothetical protein
MDTNLQELFKNMPSAAGRSRLEAYKELVLRLRRGGHSYEAIRTILADRCYLQISKNALVEFIQRRSRPRKPTLDAAASAPEPLHSISVESGNRPQGRHSPEEVAAMREAARAANHKPTVKPKESPIFEYDPTRPLTNRPS